MRLTDLVAVMVAIASLLSAPKGARAQSVSVPAFPVAGSQAEWEVDVAGNVSGLFFLQSETGPTIRTRRLFAATWSASAPLNSGGSAVRTRLVANPLGGFTATWLQQGGVVVRPLDVAGNPIATPFEASDPGTSGQPSIASLANGDAVVAWIAATDSIQVLVGSRLVDVAALHVFARCDVAATPNGGFVVMWLAVDDDVTQTSAQFFDTNGDELTDPVVVVTSVRGGPGAYYPSRVAASPTDGLVLVGQRKTGTAGLYDVVLQRFDTSGALGSEVVVDTIDLPTNTFAPEHMTTPDAAFDFAGNLYVIWGDIEPGTVGVRARAYDAAGTAYGPTQPVTSQRPTFRVRTASLPDGRLAVAWPDDVSAWGAVLTLCTDQGAVCGDGVVTTPCERCDDGVANSDTVPNACRSDCLPARRGDGVVDAGEECDDGNFESCDGCDAGGHLEPGFACGDGVTSHVCGEQCDDANGTMLDGCSPSCALERIPGGGSPATDCISEWSVNDPTNVPAYDKRGAISATQTCVDNDATCDADGGTPGSCTFRVRACGNNTDVEGCEAPPRLASWALIRPSEAQGVKRPYLAAIRAALLGSVPAATVGTDARDVCSAFTDVTVPLKVAAGRQHLTTVKMKTQATTYEGKVDKDALTLVCLPQP